MLVFRVHSSHRVVNLQSVSHLWRYIASFRFRLWGGRKHTSISVGMNGLLTEWKSFVTGLKWDHKVASANLQLWRSIYYTPTLHNKKHHERMSNVSYIVTTAENVTTFAALATCLYWRCTPRFSINLTEELTTVSTDNSSTTFWNTSSSSAATNTNAASKTRQTPSRTFILTKLRLANSGAKQSAATSDSSPLHDEMPTQHP